MTTQAHNLANTRRAFTFTEILIALALIVVLLIGVSQVFTLTGETISRSQAFSNATRTQRAIQQTLSTDILGVDPDDDRNGFVPMQVNSSTVPSGSRQPFLIISNFRVPAYLNAQDDREDIDRPLANANFQVRSQAIRSIDISGNGLIDGNENLSIYDLGLRNFRTDTFTFFSRGQFSRQIAESGTSPSQFSSGEAMIHYGHLRLFNGEQEQRNDADEGYGPPGYLNTQAGTAGRPNRNNVYAEQFALGRVQFLLRDYQTIGSPSLRVVADDSGNPLRHVSRQWVNVVDSINVGTPFDVRNSSVSSGTPTAYIDPVTDAPTATQFTSVKLMDVRTDVMGINLDTAERRIEAQQRLDPSGAWWTDFPGTSYVDRLLAATNPLRPFSAATLAQRHHVLAQSCTQFIVEFAGDFFTQDPVTGVLTAVVSPGPGGWINAPDGVDYMVEPNTGRRSIRWYGLPRDANGDGVIGGAGVNPHEIPDVLPVRDFAIRRGAAITNFPFEREVPPYEGDYASVVNEPGASPDQSGYVCVWGPYEMANFNGFLTSPPNPPGIFHTGVPSLIRITVEIRDPNNRLAEPVVQQYIFPLRQ